VFGKRGRESLERVATTTKIPNRTRNSAVGTDDTSDGDVVMLGSYSLFDHSELTPLNYFELSINGYTLLALVDSGSHRTLFGAEVIEIVRRLNLPTKTGRTSREGPVSARCDSAPTR